MTDISGTIAPKSDQMNADDLIAGPRTITVTKVLLCGEPDQPVAIHFEGDQGKPYKACKSMRRVLVHIWGPDANKYVGRRMTLYRDDKVMFGGVAVGGIRISHMSGIDKPVTMALTATRANRKPFTVAPLRDDGSQGQHKPAQRPQDAPGAASRGSDAPSQPAGQAPAGDAPTPDLRERVSRACFAMASAKSAEALEKVWTGAAMAGLRKDVEADADLKQTLDEAYASKAADFRVEPPAEVADAEIPY